MDRDRELEAGDLEHPPHLVVAAADHDPAAAVAVGAAVEPLPGAHDQGDPGRVDELALGEVDQDRGVVGRDRLLERALQLGGGAEVELAAHGDDADPAVELGGGCLEGRRIHAPMLPQAIGLALERAGLRPTGRG